MAKVYDEYILDIAFSIKSMNKIKKEISVIYGLLSNSPSFELKGIDALSKKLFNLARAGKSVESRLRNLGSKDLVSMTHPKALASGLHSALVALNKSVISERNLGKQADIARLKIIRLSKSYQHLRTIVSKPLAITSSGMMHLPEVYTPKRKVPTYADYFAIPGGLAAYNSKITKQLALPSGIGTLEHLPANIGLPQIKDYRKDISLLERLGWTITKVKNKIGSFITKNNEAYRAERKAARATREMARAASGLNGKVGRGNSLLETWWKRFGEVGLGFTVVYRAMNAVEMGFGAIINSMGEAIRLSGEFVEIQARLAMSGMLFGSNAKNYAQAFKLAGANIAAFKEATIGAISSINDLMQGLDEASQWNYTPTTKKMMQTFVNFEDFVNIVATTTGNAGRQIRQEIQALFQGNNRVGNIVVKLLHNLMRVGVISKETLKNIVAGGKDSFNTLNKVVALFGGLVGKMKAALMQASPSYAWTVGYNKYILTLQNIITKANPIAKQLGFLGKSAKDNANIFAVAINRAFKSIDDAVKSKNFQKALAINMVAFIEFAEKLVSASLKVMKAFTYMGAAFRIMPTWVKRLGELAIGFSLLSSAAWAGKFALRAFIGILSFGLKPLTMTVRGFGALLTLFTAKGFEEACIKIGAALGTLARKVMELGAASLAMSWKVAAGIAAIGGLLYLRHKVYTAGVKRANEELKSLQNNEAGSLKNAKLSHSIDMYSIMGESDEDIKKAIIARDKAIVGRKDFLTQTLNFTKSTAAKIGNTIGNAIKGMYKKFELGSDKEFNKWLKSTFPKMNKGLDKSGKAFINGLRTNFRSMYDKAIRSGDLSLAKRLVPYVKKENQLGIDSLNTEYKKLLGLLVKTSGDANKKIRLALEANRIKEADLEKSLSINPEADYYKANYSKYKAQLWKKVEAYKEVNNSINHIRLSDFAKYKLDLKKRIETYRKAGVDEATLAKYYNSQIESYLIPKMKSFNEKRVKDKEDIDARIRELDKGAYATFKFNLDKKLKAYRKEGIDEVTREKLKNSEIENYFGKTIITVASMWKNATSAMSETFSSLFTDVVQRKLKSLKDYAMSIFNSISSYIAGSFGKIFAQKSMSFVGGLIPGLSTLFKAEGGIFPGSFTPISAFADGGIVSQPTFGVVGEGKGPEAVIPLKNGNVPVKMNESKKEKPTEIHITNIVDPALFGDYMTSPQGENAVLNIIARNNYKIRRSLG